ncbi:MAG: hypothetical protein Q9170_006043 [Blastenia crenularia]
MTALQEQVRKEKRCRLAARNMPSCINTMEQCPSDQAKKRVSSHTINPLWCLSPRRLEITAPAAGESNVDSKIVSGAATPLPATRVGPFCLQQSSHPHFLLSNHDPKASPLQFVTAAPPRRRSVVALDMSY